MVRQAHHERNQQFTVRPEPVEGFNQRFPSICYAKLYVFTQEIYSSAPPVEKR